MNEVSFCVTQVCCLKAEPREGGDQILAPEITHAPMGPLFLTKEARIYNGEKTAPSINGAGKAGEHCVKKLN